MTTSSNMTGVDTPPSSKDKFISYLLIVVIAIGVFCISAGIFALIWLASGSPCGSPSFWKFIISAGIYTIVLALYLPCFVEKRGELSDGECISREQKVSFCMFVRAYPWFSLFGLFLVADFLVCIFFNVYIAWAGVIVPVVASGVCRCMYNLLRRIHFTDSATKSSEASS